MPLRIAFFGTPSFAVPSLEALIASSHAVVGVVTQPDRPRGRGQHISHAPVKVAALAAGLPILQPARLKDEGFLDVFRAWDVDLGVVAAYGRLLPQALLDIPSRGMINVHASLLPAYRGASPIQRAVLNGDTVTGVTIMRVVLALDAGPMLDSVETPIDPDDTSGSLEARLALAGAALVRDVVDRLEDGTITETPQDDSLATFAPRILKQDGAVSWDRPAAVVHNHVRGMLPWPVAFSYIDGQRVLVRETRLSAQVLPPTLPGTVLGTQGDAMTVACGEGTVLDVVRLQPDGRKTMTAREWLAGRRPVAAWRFADAP